MGAFVGVAIALLGMHLRPEPGTVQVAAIDGALVYHVRVPPAVLKRTPAWAEGQDPPLSPLRAMLLADAKRAKLVQDSADYKWELDKPALRPALGVDRWYYEISYIAHFQGAASTGYPPSIRLIVLMDGTVPDPVVWERADWMRAMKAGTFDPSRRGQ
jgi:hypothetical protein